MICHSSVTLFRVSERQETHGRGTCQSDSVHGRLEYEATQMYMQLAESTDNKLAVAVLKDIADEELVHAGEFLKLLYALAPMRRRSMQGAEKCRNCEVTTSSDNIGSAGTEAGLHQADFSVCGVATVCCSHCELVPTPQDCGDS